MSTQGKAFNQKIVETMATLKPKDPLFLRYRILPTKQNARQKKPIPGQKAKHSMRQAYNFRMSKLLESYFILGKPIIFIFFPRSVWQFLQHAPNISPMNYLLRQHGPVPQKFLPKIVKEACYSHRKATFWQLKLLPLLRSPN